MNVKYPIKGLMIIVAFLFLSILPGSISGQGCPTGLINGDFEDFNQPANSFAFRPNSFGWTSIGQGFLEIWGSGWTGVPSYEGIDFMELNSGGPDIVIQDLVTTPGAVYDWQVAHRGRGGVDVADLEFGPPAGPYTVAQSMSDGTAAWGFYTGTYTVPAGQTTTRVRFRSVSFGGGCGSCANFIDAFDFQVADSDGDGVVDCLDGCPEDADKTEPGICGCGTSDADTDEDGIVDCNDNCADAANGDQSDSDCDGVGDACDVCPGGDDSVDNNGDGLPDCHNLPAYEDIEASWTCELNKVLVAHHTGNGSCHTICIDYTSVQDHLDHGDYIGACGHASCNEESFAIPDVHLVEISSMDLEVYPNPAGEEVNILLNTPGVPMTVTICDNFGKVIRTEQWDENRRHLSVDISGNNFVNGVYYVYASTDTQVFVQRFVISK